jgi:hypothetical protein
LKLIKRIEKLYNKIMGIYCKICGDSKHQDNLNFNNFSLDSLGDCKRCGYDLSKNLTMSFLILREFLKEKSPIVSEESGKEYDAETLDDRLMNVMKHLSHSKSFNRKKLQRALPRGDARKLLSNLLDTVTHDLVPGKHDYKNWNQFIPVDNIDVGMGKVARKGLPYQGWKIHISSYPYDCRKVLKPIVDMLRGKNISFKSPYSIEQLTDHEDKLLTIYPRANWSHYIDNQYQKFLHIEEGDRKYDHKWKHNFRSMNSNILNTIWILESLDEILTDNNLNHGYPKLEGGGKLKYERQYKGRIFYRYSHVDPGSCGVSFESGEQAYSSRQRQENYVYSTRNKDCSINIYGQLEEGSGNYKPPTGIGSDDIYEVFDKLPVKSLQNSRFK